MNQITTPQLPESIGLTVQQANILANIRKGFARDEQEILETSVQPGRFFAAIWIKYAPADFHNHPNQRLVTSHVQAFIGPKGGIQKVIFYPTVSKIRTIRGKFLPKIYLKLC